MTLYIMIEYTFSLLVALAMPPLLASAGAADSVTWAALADNIVCMMVCRLLDGMVRWFGQEGLIL